MDLGLRDWLLIIGPVVIVGILIHGYIRMRRASGSLKMDLDPEFQTRRGERNKDVDTLQLLRAELPSGGARVVKPPEQGSLNLQDDVPVLMDPVEVPEAAGDSEEADEASGAPASDRGEIPHPRKRPAQLVVLHVFARGGTFNGQELLENLVNYGLKFGEMDIFHYYGSGGERVQFSLANSVEPGTFDLHDMDTLETPGVSLFIELQNQEEPLSAFDRMLDTARRLASDMSGELRDIDRNVMTDQTIGHCRQTVIDYTMKHG